MSDSQQIILDRVEMCQWRITGSDGTHQATITASRGESVKLEHDSTYQTGYSADLATAIGAALIAAATFIEGEDKEESRREYRS